MSENCEASLAEVVVRFDLRVPEGSTTAPSTQYRSALDMAVWADRSGFDRLVFLEHHGRDDGYLPSPLVMAGAALALTRSIRVEVVTITAFNHPLRLAEDAAVADLIGDGRLDITLVNGYVASEFAMFGRSLSERAAQAEETVRALRSAWTGEPFDFRGAKVQVRPRPAQPGGPKLALGGSSVAAARRAARLGDSFASGDTELWRAYRAERNSLGKPDPGPLGHGGGPPIVVARDVEATKRDIAPFVRHDRNTYAAWQAEAKISGGRIFEPVVDDDALWASGHCRVVTPEALVAEIRSGAMLRATFHPLMGGTPPDLAWQSLQLFATNVLPHVRPSAAC